ncbi:phospholipase A1 VesT1.02-like [Maniola hyperantus]|uniref:phospholipase A1 VesT1.02-like n=1 Tax=Aphantopus hyperantus TaxID=2795564 RepID=UPI00156A38C2|nr:phospholipase A1 VesT1.02-like [Maniola hyperantus]
MCSCNKMFWTVWVILIGYSLDYSHGVWLRCYKSSMNNYTFTPLNDPVRLLHDPCFDPNLRTLIYTFGYRGKCNGPATTAVLTAYIGTKKKNIILLDWEEEAKSGVLGIPLGYALLAVPNAKRIGQELGEALLTLSRAGLNLSEVQLMGHSLGAHVMGYAGRWTRQRGQVLSRITGLDPARAFFDGMFSIQSGLDRTCAKFVDIIHTNPGKYGTSKSTGTVDWWPNYSVDDGMQPGCPSGKFDMFTPEDLCSHDRSWRYLVESIHSGTAFPATPAENHDAWLSLKQPPSTTMYMGELANTRARGNFFFRTNSHPPYSMGSRGMMPDTNRSPLSTLLKFVR